MKFNKEEISLCKQVAEKHRKEVEYGGWYISYDKEIRLKTFFGTGFEEEKSIPLWTISDCLEFLREKGSEWVDIRIHYPDTVVVEWAKRAKDVNLMENYRTGDTLLEACLKAVLAVLEEGK